MIRVLNFSKRLKLNITNMLQNHKIAFEIFAALLRLTRLIPVLKLDTMNIVCSHNQPYKVTQIAMVEFYTNKLNIELNKHLLNILLQVDIIS